jgi:peptidoglycan hydrolase CwlO-like protein
MDLTVLVDEDRKSKTVTIGTICQVGYDLVFNSRDNPVEAQNIRNFLVGLKEDVRVEYLNFRIKEEGEKLADMEKSLKKLESKKTGLEKDIESYQKKIEDAKNDIAKTTTEIENTKTQIEGQRRNIENVKKEF